MKYLPLNTGPYQVGCCDIITKFGLDRLLFRLYYPTAADLKLNDSTSTKWLSDPQYADGFCDFLNIKFLSKVFNWLTSSVRVNAIWNSPLEVPENLSKLPVVVFSHGLGGNRTCYSSICTDLASKGVLVAAVEHTDKSASCTYYLEPSETSDGVGEKKWVNFQHVKSGTPDEHNIRNNQVRFRSKECSALLDQICNINDGNCDFVHCDIDLTLFKSNLDVTNCAIMGHSFGAATTIAVLSQDERFKVGVGLDPWMFPLDTDIYKSLSPVPFLCINTENFHWLENIASMRKLDADVFDITAERKMVTLVGTVHQSQTDFPHFVGNGVLAKFFKLSGSSDPSAVFKINNTLAFGFIGKHLNLHFSSDVDDVVKENKALVYFGSNVTVDEERIKISKSKLSTL